MEFQAEREQHMWIVWRLKTGKHWGRVDNLVWLK